MCMLDNQGRFAMADQRGITYYVVGGALGIRGAAWMLPTALSAWNAQEAIMGAGLFTPTDQVMPLVGRRIDDNSEQWVLALLFASNLSGVVLEKAHNLIIERRGAAIRDWDTVPAELLGKALQLLLRDTVESSIQPGPIFRPDLLRPSPLFEARTARTSDTPACSECGAMMVRQGACYKCLNCGATTGCP